jgi:hypothetical protein
MYSKTENFSICPVCKTEILDSRQDIYTSCGFHDVVNLIACWANIEDAKIWYSDIVKPYQLGLELQSQQDIISDALMSLEKDFVNALKELDSTISAKLREHDQTIQNLRVQLIQTNKLNNNASQEGLSKLNQKNINQNTIQIGGLIELGDYHWRVINIQKNKALIITDE